MTYRLAGSGSRVGWALILASALLTASCRRDGGPAEARDGASADAAGLAATQPALPPVAIDLVNGQRFGAQVFASQDAAEAAATLRALEALGYRGLVLRADLSERGVWHRVVLGDVSRAELAESVGRRAAQDPRVRAVLPEVAPGEPHFLLRDDLPGLEVAPRAAQAAVQLAAGQALRAAVVRANPALPSGLLLEVQGDVRPRPIDAAGVAGEPWPLPGHATCSPCALRAAASRPKAMHILLAEDVAGDASSEVLLEHALVDGSRLASLWRAASPAPVELLGFVLELQEPNRQELGTWLLVEADGDADQELRLVQDVLVTHEGDLCQVQRSVRLFDLDDAGAHPIDRAFFAALAKGPAADRGRFERLLRSASDEPQDLALLVAAADYLSADATAGDVEAQRLLFGALDAARGGGAPFTRLAVLARLSALRTEFRVALAPRLLKHLEELLADRRVSVDVRGCDEAPLERAGSWNAKQRVRWADALRHALDLRALPPEVWGDLARAHDATTPIGLRVEELLARLQPAAVAHAAARQAMTQARARTR